MFFMIFLIILSSWNS